MDEAHKYLIENIDSMQVHVKELRKTLKPGEKREWEGVLTEGTKRLKEKGLLSVKDLGAVGKAKEAPKPAPKVEAKPPSKEVKPAEEKKPAPKVEAKPKEEPKPAPKPAPEVKTSPKVETKPTPEVKTPPKVEAKPAPKAEAKPLPKIEVKSVTKLTPEAEAKLAQKPKPKPEPKVEPVTIAPEKTKDSAKPKTNKLGPKTETKPPEKKKKTK